MSDSSAEDGCEACKVQHILVRAPKGHKVNTLILNLQPLKVDDVDDYYALHADARVWQHLPSGRHTDTDKSKKAIAEAKSDWEKHGLGYWSVKSSDGDFVGVGGVRLMSGKGRSIWNIYYRVSPDWWGCGVAGKIASQAMQAANRIYPDVPVVAYLLEHNKASRHIAESSLQLKLRWRGPDRGNNDPKAIRLVFSDSSLDEATSALVTA